MKKSKLLEMSFSTKISSGDIISVKFGSSIEGDIAEEDLFDQLINELRSDIKRGCKLDPLIKLAVKTQYNNEKDRKKREKQLAEQNENFEDFE